MIRFFEYLGGKKMFFALLLTILITIFLIFGKCTFSEWADFCIWINGAYIVGNGIEHFSKRKKIYTK
jgi:hypothetical protein